MLISQAEWARQQGVSRQYVSGLVKKGVIRLIDGKIDPAQAKNAVESIKDPAREPRRKKIAPVTPQPLVITPPSPVTPPAPQEVVHTTSGGDLPTKLLLARVRTEVKKGGLLELREKKELGLLVDAQDVRKAAFARGREFRAALENWSTSAYRAMADDLGVDDQQMRVVLDRHVRALLLDLAGRISPKEMDG